MYSICIVCTLQCSHTYVIPILLFITGRFIRCSSHPLQVLYEAAKLGMANNAYVRCYPPCTVHRVLYENVHILMRIILFSLFPPHSSPPLHDSGLRPSSATSTLITNIGFHSTTLHPHYTIGINGSAATAGSTPP